MNRFSTVSTFSRSIVSVLAFGLVGLISGCGGGTDVSANGAPPAATLSSIAVTSAAASIAKGATTQFTATGTYSDGTTQNLSGSATWASSATGVATISATGLATAVAAGTATITATSGSISGTATLTVTAPTLTSIAVANASVINGSTAQLVATGTYSDGSTANITTTASWTSTPTTIATVGATTGIATGVAVGTASITAALSGITSPAATLTVSAAEYAYVSNLFDNTISVYTVGAGGALVANANGPTVAAVSEPYGLAVDSSHHYLYAVNYHADSASTISQYAIGTDGTLSPLTPATVPAGIGPSGITVYGSYLYVANYGVGTGTTSPGTLVQYSIGAGGQLTLASSAPAGVGASVVTINALGTIAYVTNYLDSTISIYTIGATGVTAASTVALPAATYPADLILDPSGQFAYVADLGHTTAGTTISQFSVTAATGALTPSSTATVATGSNPRWLALNPSGNYVYVPNAGSNTVQQFSLGSTGLLAPVSTATLAAGSNPAFAVVDPSGQYLYVADRGGGDLGLTAPFGNTVSQFAIADTGALTPLSTPTVASGNEPAFILVTTAY